MKIKHLVSIALLILISSSVFGFDPSELNRLTITNGTGSTINYLFISPGDSENWGPDMLGTDVLTNGASVAYFMHYPGTSGAFDILAVDDKNQRYEVRNFTLRDGTEGRIRLAANNRTSIQQPQIVNVTVRNKTGYSITYMFFSPADSTMYGADILGDSKTLGAGETHTFGLLKTSQSVKYDFWAIDEDGDEYKFSYTVNPNRANQSVDLELSDRVK